MSDENVTTSDETESIPYAVAPSKGPIEDRVQSLEARVAALEPAAPGSPEAVAEEREASQLENQHVPVAPVAPEPEPEPDTSGF